MLSVYIFTQTAVHFKCKQSFMFLFDKYLLFQEIYSFQQQFLHTMENALDTEAQFMNLDTPSQFKVLLDTPRYS